MRVLVRRERPHPGAQISVFEAHDGWRYQCRGHRHPGRTAGVPGGPAPRPRPGRGPDQSVKQTGLGRFPSREFTINAVWLQLALTAADLIAWTQTILLDGAWPRPSRRQLRYRLLHTAARITHRGRRTFIKIATGWPWAADSPPRSPGSPDPTTAAHLTASPPDHPQPRTQETRTPGRPHPHAVRRRSTTPWPSAAHHDHSRLNERVRLARFGSLCRIVGLSRRRSTNRPGVWLVQRRKPIRVGYPSDVTETTLLAARPASVGAMLIRRVEATSSKEAFRYVEDDRWVSLSWLQTKDKAFQLAAGLLALGVGPEDRVAIASSTRMEWVLADLAIMCAAGATTAIYPSTQHEDVRFILADSQSKMVVAEDDVQVGKILDHLDELPELINIVQLDGKVDHPKVIGWGDLERLGREYLDAHPTSVDDVIAAIGPEDSGDVDLHLRYHWAGPRAYGWCKTAGPMRAQPSRRTTSSAPMTFNTCGCRSATSSARP